jgi:hypothetical protein
VDRRAIDWRAVRSGASGADRAALDALHLVEQLRNSAARQPEPSPSPTAHPAAVGIAALAALQTAACMLVLLSAWAGGEPIARRLMRMSLAGSFAVSALVLWPASRVDGSSGYLLIAYTAAASAFARASTVAVGAASLEWVMPLLRGLYPETFIPACLWWFALNFPSVRRFTAFDLLGRRVAAAATCVGIALFAVNLLAAYGLSLPSVVTLLLRNHPGNGFWTLFVLFTAPAVGAAFVRARRAAFSERRRTLRFAAALVIGAGPMLAAGVARALLPAFDRWIIAGKTRIWLDLLLLVPLLSTPLLTAVVLRRDRPFGVTVFFTPARRRWLARAAVTAGALLPFACCLVVMYYARDQPLGAAVRGPLGWLLIASAVAGGVLLAARSAMLRALDQRIAGRSAGVDAELLETLDRIRSARTTGEMIEVIARQLRRITGARHVAVLVPSATGFTDPRCRLDLLDAHSALAHTLRHTSPLDVSAEGRLFALLPEADRKWLAANTVDLAAAVTHRDGALAAVIVLGPRRRRTAYTAAERWLVTTIATTAAAAWESGRDHGPEAESDDAAVECPHCGAVAPSLEALCSCGDPRAAALPHRLGGKFVVEQHLGAGSMGVVYRARDTALDRDVAIKTLPQVSEAAVARLRWEARAMAALDSQGLAIIYGLEVWRRTPALIVEYLPCGTLADRLRSSPVLPEIEVVQLGIRLARTLSEIHGRGLLHRDIKPSNIGLTAAGTPKLLDFGLAVFRTTAQDGGHGGTAASGAPSADGRLAGTPAYLPPEALAGAPAATSSDLWALSVVLYEALTGSRSRSARPNVPSLPGVWQWFFERALAEDPLQRFGDAAELTAALEEVQRALDRARDRP